MRGVQHCLNLFQVTSTAGSVRNLKRMDTFNGVPFTNVLFGTKSGTADHCAGTCFDFSTILTFFFYVFLSSLNIVIVCIQSRFMWFTVPLIML